MNGRQPGGSLWRQSKPARFQKWIKKQTKNQSAHCQRDLADSENFIRRIARRREYDARRARR